MITILEGRWPRLYLLISNIHEGRHAFTYFYVLLTVHLGSFLVNNQLDPLFFFAYIYSSSLHVLRIPVLIIRRISYINVTSGICHCM